MKRGLFWLVWLPFLGICACSSAGRDGSQAVDDSSKNGAGGENAPQDVPPDAAGNSDPSVLDARVESYTEALRTASLKLVQNLPTLEQIKRLEATAEPRIEYEAAIDSMLADARFTGRMIKWWSDTMRQGGAGTKGVPSRDTAPTFAARVFIEERPYTDLFTAQNNTCPKYDNASNTFVDGECNNGVSTHAGVLTNPGVMMQFYGNMAFRRVRWVQEVFVCTKFPAEYTAVTKVGDADYTAPWNFQSIASSPINFQDTSSAVCANCHATINHIAPLFANFDSVGQWQSDSQVMTPMIPEPTKTELSHWLNPGESTAWRFGKEVSDLPALGQAMAADPDVHECAVARMYNFAMSKEDIVSDLATVPPAVLKPYVDEFVGNGLNLKKTLRAILVCDDFVKF